MGEEVKITDDNDNNRVVEWEDGLPSFDDLTPLSTSLIPPALASAFRITPEPSKTMTDVNRASENTFCSLQIISEKDRVRINNEVDVEEEEEGGGEEEEPDLTDSRKTRRIEEAAAAATDDDNNLFSTNNKAIKRPRLVWTPQLHKRFVDVVAHLGIKNAVPKTIMQLMNVEGLTRENVASHLQKYRLYLKRMQGLSNEGPSSSDHLFASTPVPQSLQQQQQGNNGGSGNGVNSSGNNNGHNMAMPMPMPMMYPSQMMPMPMMGMSGHGFHGHPYWSGNKFGPYHGGK